MITSEKAHRVIAVSEAKAKEIGQPMNIAVVDAGTIDTWGLIQSAPETRSRGCAGVLRSGLWFCKDNRANC